MEGWEKVERNILRQRREHHIQVYEWKRDKTINHEKPTHHPLNTSSDFSCDWRE